MRVSSRLTLIREMARTKCLFDPDASESFVRDQLQHRQNSGPRIYRSIWSDRISCIHFSYFLLVNISVQNRENRLEKGRLETGFV